MPRLDRMEAAVEGHNEKLVQASRVDRAQCTCSNRNLTSVHRIPRRRSTQRCSRASLPLATPGWRHGTRKWGGIDRADTGYSWREVSSSPPSTPAGSQAEVPGFDSEGRETGNRAV
ncbi:unnamed protein product [Ectocarpus sp. 4 AP-2014]